MRFCCQDISALGVLHLGHLLSVHDTPVSSFDSPAMPEGASSWSGFSSKARREFSEHFGANFKRLLEDIFLVYP